MNFTHTIQQTFYLKKELSPLSWCIFYLMEGTWSRISERIYASDSSNTKLMQMDLLHTANAWPIWKSTQNMEIGKTSTITLYLVRCYQIVMLLLLCYHFDCSEMYWSICSPVGTRKATVFVQVSTICTFLLLLQQLKIKSRFSEVFFLRWQYHWCAIMKICDREVKDKEKIYFK